MFVPHSLIVSSFLHLTSCLRVLVVSPELVIQSTSGLRHLRDDDVKFFLVLALITESIP